MDPLIWLVLSAIVGIALLVAVYVSQRSASNRDKKQHRERPAVARGGGQGAVVAGGMRRARNIRARVAAVQRARGQIENIPEESQEEDEEEGSDMFERAEKDEEEQKLYTGKIGTKKLKKIQEKAERKAAREQEEALREDRKKREALREEERKREIEAELVQKKKDEEEQAQLKEEREKKELEEYLLLKEAFVVEGEGHGAAEEEEARSVQDFVDHLKKNKIVYMEDLAAEFNMKTQDAIARVQSLQESGELTGVIDDRGKFIFISQEELQAVATFIKQRGRVSISDLVTSSNTLINLQPETESLTA